MLHKLFGKEGIKGKWGQEDKYEQLSVGQALSQLLIDIIIADNRHLYYLDNHRSISH
jgi:hypothetical protein